MARNRERWQPIASYLFPVRLPPALLAEQHVAHAARRRSTALFKSPQERAHACGVGLGTGCSDLLGGDVGAILGAYSGRGHIRARAVTAIPPLLLGRPNSLNVTAFRIQRAHVAIEFVPARRAGRTGLQRHAVPAEFATAIALRLAFGG